MGEMTNEQAVRWLKDLLKSDLPMEQYQTAIGKGIEALESKWIPVSERLPKIGKRVLVTYNQEDKLKVDTTTLDRHGFLIGVVTAWMPLPAPYEPQESEGV